METKESLYRKKGELVTQIEILTAQLNAVNQKLVEVFNLESKSNGVKPVEAKE